ncbi:MAG TPA: LamG domain-containing protein [Phycisphaerae bacterium]|nr:LamG domain-containing protein [Phycisphaerae bacterium]
MVCRFGKQGRFHDAATRFHKRGPRGFMLSLLVGVSLTIARSASAGQEGMLAWWRFDEGKGNATIDAASRMTDQLGGNFRFAEGASGTGLKCDGFTTCLTRKAKDTPKLGDTFTIQAWIAVQAYPWGWCPVVTQRAGQTAGYLFGVDARGRVGLHLALGGQWRECTSETMLPLMKWAHVAGTFDAGSGLTIYINGAKAGHLPLSGAPTYAEDVDLLIGRNHTREPAMFSALWGATDQPIHFSFDGIIDEVKIHDRCLTPAEIQKSFEDAQPNTPPGLKPRRMPSGPEGTHRFGAFYHQLKYCEEWDAIWRGSGPDVLVAFKFAPVRLVFWRGASYAPCWVTEKGNWFTNEFMERGPNRKSHGCSESMSDKRAHYSHVKILENSDARAVVYWRNAPVGVNYEFAFVDEVTGWGDWSEEYHTIYPDGVAVRKVVMWSSNFKEWHEWCQSIQPLHDGQRPEDVLDPKRIMSVANMKGETKSFGRESGPKSYGFPTIPGANIQIVYLDSRFNPFLVLDDSDGKNDRGRPGPEIVRASGDGWSEHSIFPWGNHWPVTQVPLLARYPQAADRPSHTWTSTQYSAPYESTNNSMTKIMLCGMTDKSAEELLPLARSWLRPPGLTIHSAAFADEGYDPTQRAYVLTCKNRGKPAKLEAVLAAGQESPVVNPALIIRDWGKAGVKVSLNHVPIVSGEDYTIGHRERFEGADLIAWIRTTSTTPMHIELAPSGD